MDLISIVDEQFPHITGMQAALFCFLGVFLAALLLMGIRRNKISLGQAVCLLGVYAWLYFVFMLTVFSRKPHVGYEYELIPFWSYAYVIEKRSAEMAKQMVLNVFLLMPAGILGYSACRKKYCVWQITAVGFLTSFLIETLQLVMQRGLFEWDDMIHNTLGVYLGCRGFQYVMDKRKK